jgi:hypothetical protein
MSVVAEVRQLAGRDLEIAWQERLARREQVSEVYH